MSIPHAWQLSPAEAIALQQQLTPQVNTTTPLDLKAIHTVAGVDVSVKDNISRAAIVVLSFPELNILETVTAQIPTPFPYIPGLLSFREGAVILEAHQQLKNQPDVYLFDGMGIMHPRRFGVASHLGLWFNKPTIGCGKTHFLGTYDDPANTQGSFSKVMDKIRNPAQEGMKLSKSTVHDSEQECIGVVLRTRTNVKPIYVSVGHLATLDTAIDCVLRCTKRYRLPEPIRAAHQAAGKSA